MLFQTMGATKVLALYVLLLIIFGYVSIGNFSRFASVDIGSRKKEWIFSCESVSKYMKKIYKKVSNPGKASYPGNLPLRNRRVANRGKLPVLKSWRSMHTRISYVYNIN